MVVLHQVVVVAEILSQPCSLVMPQNVVMPQSVELPQNVVLPQMRVGTSKNGLFRGFGIKSALSRS